MDGRRRRGDDDGDLHLRQLGGEARQPFVLALGEAILDGDVLAVDVPELAQPLAKRLLAARLPGPRQIANARDLPAGRLGVEGERQQRDREGDD